MSDTSAKPVRPIIVIKKKASHGGHHGGAWKVAYADFVTAMMSLFIVLWLLNSTPQIKKAVAGYFNDPRGTNKETGTSMAGTGQAVNVDKQNVEKIKEEIQKAILKQADLTKLSKQVEITITDEGLKIELIEDQSGTFFESGSPKLSEAGTTLLNLIASQLKILPNHLLIEGHTDAQPYASNDGYTNWELSSDRANSARRVLQQGGVGPNQISQVRGYADQLLRVPANPLDPSNRRISLIVQWVTPGTTTPPAPETTPNQPSANSSKAQPTPQPTHPPPPETIAANSPAPPPLSAHLATPQPATSLFARIKALVPRKIH
jgi:chemotaxis protein MotB